MSRPLCITLLCLTIVNLNELSAQKRSNQTSSKPNIVIIVTDDHGYGDVGYHDEKVKTPHLDKFVKQGVRLDRHYSYPICSMTRAALMTGLSTSRTGVNNSSGLDLKYQTMPESFRAAGYQTWMCGKWHLGGAADAQRSGKEFLPTSRGFDYFYGHLGGAIDYVTHSRKDLGKLDWQRNGKDVQEEGFSTDLLADDACKLIKARDPAKPMFLYLAFNAVHGPLNPPPGSNTSKRDKRDNLLANVTYMDAAIGRVLQTLDDENIADNTIVVFFSDNGGQLGNGASNGSLRGEKGTVFEGGIHTLGAIRWPAALKAGKASKQVISVIDWFPTLADAAGIKAIHDQPFDGKSRWKNLREGTAAPPENLVIAHSGIAVFNGPWKLVEGSDEKGDKGGGGGKQAGGKQAGKNAKKGKRERKDQGDANPAAAAGPAPQLFNIEQDPGETTDLSAKHPEIVRELLAAGKKMTSLSPRQRKGKQNDQ